MREYLENRIKELKEADAKFCEDRWDMSKPKFQREIGRTYSIAVTQARQELEKVLELLETK